VFFILKIERWR